MRKAKQTSLFKTEKSDYGGSLRSTRRGRAHARPLAVKTTMHLILRSSKATGAYSFRNPKHEKNIRRIIEKFAFVYGVKVISIANAWNHLHLQIKLSNRFTYTPFIKAVTGSIAMSVTGRSRWQKVVLARGGAIASGVARRARGSSGVANSAVAAKDSEKFWDQRSFTRIVQSLRAFLNLKDYVRMNQIEGDGGAKGT